MNKINNYVRVRRLIESAITDFLLDLRGISVLTEAASGSFVVTSLIAALAGAERVVAVTKDSNYGLASDIQEYTRKWANELGVAESIRITTEPAYMYAYSSELVTNVGFVRPIDENLINLLPVNSAISLMWETWEFRDEDVDIVACGKRGVPVLGTCETLPRLQILRYVGMLVLKLLLEANIEVFKSNILLIGSGGFGKEVEWVLRSNECGLIRLDPSGNWNNNDENIKNYIREVDAIVLVEHKEKFCLIGGETGLPLEWFGDSGALIVHVCGNVDDVGIKSYGLNKIPTRKVFPGFMSVTTDYVGPRPVIDLHTAGLKVGEALVRGMRLFGEADKAINYALDNSPAMEFDLSKNSKVL